MNIAGTVPSREKTGNERNQENQIFFNYWTGLDHFNFLITGPDPDFFVLIVSNLTGSFIFTNFTEPLVEPRRKIFVGPVNRAGQRPKISSRFEL